MTDKATIRPMIDVDMQTTACEQIDADQLKLNAICKLSAEDGVKISGLQVNLVHAVDNKEVNGSSHLTDPQGEILIEDHIINQTYGVQGKLIAVISESGMPKFAAVANVPTNITAQKNSAAEIYGRLTTEEASVVKKKSPISEQAETSQKPILADVKAKPKPRKPTLTKKTKPPVKKPDKVAIPKKPKPTKARKVRRKIGILKGTIIAGFSAIAAASTYLGVRVTETAVPLAHGVAIDAQLLPQIPIVDINSSNDHLSYLSSKTFIKNREAEWEALSEAEWETPSGTTERGYKKEKMNWNIKPVFPEDVSRGGSLYLTRRALVAAEDSLAEHGELSLNVFWGTLRALAHMGAGGGGSSIHDQLCGYVWDETQRYTPMSKLNGLDKIDRKVNETSCAIGLGLGGEMETDEVFANYMTFAFMGAGKAGVRNFIKEYWGITDLNDLTDGQKIILAAAPRSPAKSCAGTNGAIRWEIIEGRALDYVLKKRMVETGMITDQKEIDRISKEIVDARPSCFYGTEAEKTKRKESHYEFVNKLAAQEVQARLLLSNVGVDRLQEWREDVKWVYVNIDQRVQEGLNKIMSNQLMGMEDNVRGTVFVVNDKGEYVAVHTGDRKGFDNLSVELANRRFIEKESPGSLGKQAVAAAIAAKGYRVDNQDWKVQAAVKHLSKSSSAFEGSADRLLGGDYELVADILNCYGAMNSSVTTDDALNAAVRGGWQTTPNHIASMFYGLMSGKALSEPHLLVGEETKSKKIHYTYQNDINNADTCAAQIHQNGASIDWGEIPFTGTMRAMNIPEDVLVIVGKTGTANAKTAGGTSIPNTTNIVWAPFAVTFNNGEEYTVVTYLRAENTDSKHSGIDNQASFSSDGGSEEFAVPVSNKVLQLLDLSQNER